MQNISGVFSTSIKEFKLEMIVYNNFWRYLKDNNISQYWLLKNGISSSVMQRLKKGKGISTESIDRLCLLLDCNVSDIISFVKVKEEND